jgi:diaminopimelate epimerase
MTRFTKYHGTGNDFILIDDRNSVTDLSTSQIKQMCDRHFGIGADGLIIIRPSAGYDFEMLYYNSDGNRGSMCGNGGRCSVAFAHELGMLKDSTSFLAFDGRHEAKIISTQPYIVSLHMADVKHIESGSDFIFLDTGSPHYVRFQSDVHKLDVLAEGRKIRYGDRFKGEGTNVNFVQPGNEQLFIRTYERGVEDETLSCGTGVTASVIAAAEQEKIFSSPCQVDTPGGRLSVYFRKSGNGYEDVWLEGEVVKVFSGEYLL